MKKSKINNKVNKYIFLGFILLFTTIIKSQDLSKVQKVSFQYRTGGYSFGQAGIYEREEIIEFKRNSSNKFYGKRLSITKKYIKNPQTQENDIPVKDSVFNNYNKKIQSIVFQNLIEQLNTHKDNFGVKNIRPNLSVISKKEILAIAKKNHLDYLFIDDENGKVDEFGKEKIKKIRRYDKLDSFLLLKKPNIEMMMVVIDVWNHLQISFIEHNDTTRYRFDFFSLLGQPYKKTLNKDFEQEKIFINSEVNFLLMKFLAKNSQIRKAISFDRIKEEYISWYIENKILYY